MTLKKVRDKNYCVNGTNETLIKLFLHNLIQMKPQFYLINMFSLLTELHV